MLRLPPSPPFYQGVQSHHNMDVLHRGRFAEIYDRWRSLNPHSSPNETRLRHYMSCMFAEFSGNVQGDFLSAGISYGVAPHVIYDFVEFEKLGKTYHFIDPFLGINNPNDGGAMSPYNTDVNFVRQQYPVGAPVRIHQTTIPDCFPLDGLDALAFAHLNVTVAVAEADSIDYLYKKLSSGGFIIIDYYAFGRGNFEVYDQAIKKAGASIFTLVTGQGVIHKP